MALRTYGQYCGSGGGDGSCRATLGDAARSRPVAPGPRRFTDLFDGLPGIATDVLAERLRAMEAAGVVRHRTVKHPVPGKVYELAPASGEELASIARRLAGWGARLLPAAGSTEARFNPRWALQSMAGSYLTVEYRTGCTDRKVVCRRGTVGRRWHGPARIEPGFGRPRRGQQPGALTRQTTSDQSNCSPDAVESSYTFPGTGCFTVR